MLFELRKISCNYNCHVSFVKDTTGYGSASGFEIYSLNLDDLTNFMKKINELYGLKWFSNLITSSDISGFYYYIEI